MLRNLYKHEREVALEGLSSFRLPDNIHTARFAPHPDFLPMFDDRCVITEDMLFCRTLSGGIATFEKSDLTSHPAGGLSYTAVISVATGEAKWSNLSVPVEPVEDGDEFELLIRFSKDIAAVLSNSTLFKTKYLLTDGNNNPDYPVISGKNVAFGTFRTGGMRHNLLRSYTRLKYATITA